jgi:hypothetical protein
MGAESGILCDNLIEDGRSEALSTRRVRMALLVVVVIGHPPPVYLEEVDKRAVVGSSAPNHLGEHTSNWVLADNLLCLLLIF